MIITKTASCPAFGDWAIANKLNIPKSKWSSVKKGDVVLFDFNGNGDSDHVGIVESVGKNTVTTIEGNTGNGSDTNGDGVYRRTRSKSVVNYFVRPEYSGSVTADAVVKAAQAEIGYKEGKNNDNKYGKWYGLNNQPWCMIFVCWCFAHPVNATPTPAVTSGYAKGKTYTVTTTSGLNIRKTASKSAKKLGAVPKGKKVKALDVSGNWIKITYGKITGWICCKEGSNKYVK